MASFHLSAQVIGRAKGRSAIAAAAYRAGARLRDEAGGGEHDYRRRRGVVHSEILVPEGAAAWLTDRERLWNHVHAIERRKDAQLAREINVALPHELSAEERRDLVRGFVQEQFVARGMVADLAIHEPVDGDTRNHHAHILLTLRRATAEGLWRVKTREWNSDALLTSWREAWATRQNLFLDRGRHTARVDHRTLAAQRETARQRGDRAAAASLNRQPEVHIGPRAQKVGGRRQVPRSRTQEQRTARPNAGRWRSSPQPDKRQRGVHYPAIDRGSRLAYNAGRVDGHSAALQEDIARTQRRAARLRLRENRAHRTAREAEDGLLDVAAQAAAPFWRRPPKQALADRQVMFELRRRQARQRAELVRRLLGRIDGILADLFLVHGRALQRRQVLFERAAGRDAGRPRMRDDGRGRSRSPAD